MNTAELYNLTQKAFETGHVKELLLGEGEWCIPVDWKATTSIPTDWERIISYGISPYCLAEDIDARVKQFENAFKQLLSGDYISVLIAYEHYITYCYHVRSNEKNILFSSSLCHSLRNSIELHKAELAALREWVGFTYENGLYEHITATDQTLSRKFGMGVL